MIDRVHAHQPLRPGGHCRRDAGKADVGFFHRRAGVVGDAPAPFGISRRRDGRHLHYFASAIVTPKVTASALYGDAMYVSSKRMSFNDFAFNAAAGNSTSTAWVASCPGSRRSAP